MGLDITRGALKPDASSRHRSPLSHDRVAARSPPLPPGGARGAFRVPAGAGTAQKAKRAGTPQLGRTGGGSRGGASRTYTAGRGKMEQGGGAHAGLERESVGEAPRVQPAAPRPGAGSDSSSDDEEEVGAMLPPSARIAKNKSSGKEPTHPPEVLDSRRFKALPTPAPSAAAAADTHGEPATGEHFAARADSIPVDSNPGEGGDGRDAEHAARASQRPETHTQSEAASSSPPRFHSPAPGVLDDVEAVEDDEGSAGGDTLVDGADGGGDKERPPASQASSDMDLVRESSPMSSKRRIAEVDGSDDDEEEEREASRSRTGTVEIDGEDHPTWQRSQRSPSHGSFAFHSAAPSRGVSLAPTDGVRRSASPFSQDGVDGRDYTPGLGAGIEHGRARSRTPSPASFEPAETLLPPSIAELYSGPTRPHVHYAQLRAAQGTVTEEGTSASWAGEGGAFVRQFEAAKDRFGGLLQSKSTRYDAHAAELAAHAERLAATALQLSETRERIRQWGTPLFGGGIGPKGTAGGRGGEGAKEGGEREGAPQVGEGGEV